MQYRMNHPANQPAEYAIRPGIPALQVDPARLRRAYAFSLLAFLLIAAGLGYLFGRFQGLDWSRDSRTAAMDTLR